MEAQIILCPLPPGDYRDALYGMVGNVIRQKVQGLHLDLFKMCPQAQSTSGGLSHFHFLSSAKGLDDSLR